MDLQKILLYLLLFPLLTFSQNFIKNNHSPDGKIELQFQIEKGIPVYNVKYLDEQILNNSKLGFQFEKGISFTENIQVLSNFERNIDTTWYPVWGTDNTIHNHFNEMIIKLKNEEDNSLITIIFRAYNDGVAFRYVIHEHDGKEQIQIVSEETSFSFSEDMTCWWTPQDFESYEHLYNTTSLAKVKAVNTPITLQSKNGIIVTLHEAALTDYAGMTLKKDENNKHELNCDLVPWPDGIKVKGNLPLKTPWRTILIVDNPGKLIESHLIENLNEPNVIEDLSWIEPMKYIGIWWGMHIKKNTWHAGANHGATTENAKKYIDFASANGIRGVLIEGWNVGWENWGGNNVLNYTKPYPDFDIEEVVKYAKSKNVEIIGHHETAGNIASYEKQLDDAFQLYNDLGIKAVKTGYAGEMNPANQHHHGQWMVRHYRNVVKQAAKYKIMVDAHEPIKPTGIRRTWPNMMTREGVRGMEYNAWSEGNTPEHTTIIPFTRMVAGPLDYTPGVFDLKFKNENNYRVHTTLAKQLALFVILYSPLQMAADIIENYEENPAFEFIRNVKVNWDETEALECKIGEYVSIARRSGVEWFVGAITDEESRVLPLALSFLEQDKKYTATIYSDFSGKTEYELYPEIVAIDTFIVTNKSIITTQLEKSGGIAVQLKPSSGEELNLLEKLEGNIKFKTAVLIPNLKNKNLHFTTSKEIEIECKTPNTEIYYTLDESIPNMKSKKYKKPLTIDKTLTIKIIAYKKGMSPSLVVSHKIKKIEYSKYTDYSRLNLRNGLRFKYYEGEIKSVLDIEKLEMVEQGIIPDVSIDKRKRDKYFAYIFSGYIKIPISGIYTFYNESNDGSILYMDDKEIINLDGGHGAKEKSKTLALKKGVYKFEQKYFQMGGGLTDRVRWKGPNINKEEIQQNAYFHKVK